MTVLVMVSLNIFCVTKGRKTSEHRFVLYFVGNEKFHYEKTLKKEYIIILYPFIKETVR
jgi:hypothetical protein